jgi:hypothetical protein
MRITLRKVVYEVHMDHVDADGNVIAELTTQEPLTLWAHQLADLPMQVGAIVAQAESQVSRGAQD